TSEDESAAARVDSWSEGIQMLKEQPLIGIGYRDYTDHNTLTAHNSYVLCFAELGILGYFFWIALLVTTFMQFAAFRNAEGGTQPEIARWVNMARLSLIGFLFGAFFLSRTYIPLLYLLLGLAVAILSIGAQRGVAWSLPPSGKVLSRIVGWEFGSIAFIYLFIRVNMMFVK